MSSCGPPPPYADANGDSSAYEAWLACNAANAPQLVKWTGDCNAPNAPNFPGWATYEDAAEWANHCTATPVPIHPPAPPPDNPGTPGQPNPHLAPDGFGPGPGSYCDLYWDDPLCEIWGTGGGIVYTGGSGGVVEQPVIVQQGLSAVDVAQTVNKGLSTVWGAVVAGVDALISVAFSGIKAALTAIGNALMAAWAILSRLGGFILAFLQTLMRGVVRLMLGVLGSIRDRLKDLYNDVLAPIAKAAAALRSRLLELYAKFIRPVLVVIQDVRRVLNILAAFHVPFAAKLDAKLADLERRISAPLLLLLRYTNALANWINLIVTANYLIQKPIWLWSLNAYAGESTNLVLNAMTKPADPTTVAAAAAGLAAPDTAATSSNLKLYMDAGAGPYAASIADAGAVFDTVISVSA